LEVNNDTILNRKKYTQTKLPIFDEPIRDETPRHEFYFEFGDGRYLKSDKNEVQYGYENGGNYDVLFKSIRIYDGGDDPDELKKVTVNNVQAYNSSNTRILIPHAKMNRDTLDINIDIPYNQIRGGDENVIILSVKKPTIADTINGSLYLFYNKKNRERIVDNPKGNSGTSNTLPNIQFETFYFDGNNNRTYSNPNILFNNNGNTNNMSTDLGSYNSLKDDFSNFFKFNVDTLSNSDQQNIFINLSAKNNLPDMAQLEIVGLLIDDNNSKYIYRKLQLTYGKAYDPNSLLVSPLCLNCDKVATTSLNYRVNFQNNGDGSAVNIKVKIKLPSGIDQNTVITDFVFKENFNSGHIITNDTSLPGEITFIITGAMLQGYFEDDTENYDETTGYIDFSVPLSNAIDCGRNLKAQAFIVFDGQPPIATNMATTKFSNVFGFKSKGLKLGADYSTTKNEIGGFIGLVMKPNCKKEWYNQFELMAGYSRYTCDLDSAFSSCHLYSEDKDNSDLKIYELNSHNINLAIVPMHLRKDFTTFIGAGIGAEFRTLIKFGEFYATNQQQPYNDVLINFDSALFADVNLKLGRLTLGGRYLYGFELVLGNNGISSNLNSKNRVQSYLQFKL